MRNNRLGCLSATGIITAMIGLLIVVGVAYAGNQALFSPGALSAKTGAALGGVTSHAGIHACSTCHTAPFSSVRMTDRCTQCHTDVAAQLKDPSTLHGAMLKASGTSDCLACHTEHHGPQAALTITSMVDFPHASLGFSLATHTKRKDGMAFVCADCHPSGYTTYNCDTCHRLVDAAFMDQHITQYGSDCLGCHDGVETVGTGFDHSKTRFLLTGRHFSLSCASCHQDARTLKDMQSTPTACINCHAKDEPHGGRFGTDCGSCHTATAWTPAKFDHNLARFKLTGAHVSVACEACHKNGQFAGTPMDCASCHQAKSPHGDVYGTTDCGACHNPNAWDQVSYDHAQTGFVLDGAHALVNCQQCHGTTPASQMSATCATCHAKGDPHHGQLGSNCNACHTTTAWKPSTFDHSRASFVLTGAHTSLACSSCHVGGQFWDTPSACGACHSKDDPHGGQLGSNCGACHTTSAWKPATFDHSTSRFPLTGAHKTVACESCHTNGQFAGTPTTCGACHSKNDPHGGQFGSNCGACHSTSAWKPATFNHSLSGFPLTGAHASLACSKCHANGQFSGTSSACVSCHSEPSYHRGLFGTKCGACHNTSNWSAKYTGPHPSIDGRNAMNHNGASCRDCHPKTLASATCLKCHDSNNPGDGGGDGGGGGGGGDNGGG